MSADKAPAQFDDAEDDDEELDEAGYKTVKDATLFAIEVSPSMLAPPPASDAKNADRDAPVMAALRCAYQLMQQRIISNPGDMMGILLYGTQQSRFQGEDESNSSGLTYPHCYVLMDLDVPAATDVKALREMIEDERVSRSVLTPSQEPVSMANVLFCANQIFTAKAPNFLSRRLFIVTDEDDPHAKDRALRSAATVRAKDLYDLGVTLELFPINRPNQEFDRNKFYEDIIYNASPTDPDAPIATSAPSKGASAGDGISLLGSLLSSVNSKAVVRRALFSNLPLELGPGCRISVKGFILFKRQEPARSSYVWLGSEKPQIVKGVTTQLADDAARPVEKADGAARPVEKAEVKKAYRFGGEEVVFTPKEITSLRNFGDPVIRIIGFKPMSMLPVWASLNKSTFTYPSEEDFVGSTRVFSALWQKLLKDEKMGLAWLIARKNAAPALVALIPGAEQLGAHGEQIVPPGLWIVSVPYADDIRRNPETVLVRSPDSVVDAMRNIMQQLQLPKAQYDPEKYPNPALQWHYRILQALALEEDLPEKPDDKTVPRYRQISKRAGEFMAEWNEELETQYRNWQLENRGDHGGSKRKATGTTEIVAKRTKTASGPTTTTTTTTTTGRSNAAAAEQIRDQDMKQHFEKHGVDKLTVPSLKAWLETKHLSTAGKKHELVERVEEWFEQKSR